MVWKMQTWIWSHEHRMNETHFWGHFVYSTQAIAFNSFIFNSFIKTNVIFLAEHNVIHGSAVPYKQIRMSLKRNRKWQG